MNSAQHELCTLVATGLSVAGYNTVAAILGLDNIWIDWRGFVSTSVAVAVVTLCCITSRFWGAGQYALGLARFGGHHVSLHYVIADGQVAAVTPSFLGADPADSPLLGPHLNRPLAAAEDLGRELFRSLSEDQLPAALISNVAPVDIATGNRPRVPGEDRPMGLPDVWRNRFTGEVGQLLETMQSNAEATLGLTEEHLAAITFSMAPKGMPLRT